jgi:hypothetical protein
MSRLLGATVGLLLFGTISAADPVAVTSGLVHLTADEPGGFRLSGDSFDLTAGWPPSLLSGTFWTARCVLPAGCAPGSTVDFGTTTYGFSEHPDNPFTTNGPGVVNGVKYPQLFYRGEFTFAGPEVVLPAVIDPNINQTSRGPFTFTGHLSAFTTESHSGTPVFDEQLTGFGTAVVFLDPFPTFTLSDLDYTFTAVPEPSTLLLLGSGFVVAAKTLRQRRS